MRIQHNIMAMNAYRNYNNNTSALSKNLEKLSSGYKINRAGDDAAGLAISEKMRAQISGLSAASKNVKDGISLVKTAEGAMQEVQDMLNRMSYLATQSANGTYDNEVDRANLQKEVTALCTEIDRIADSANFNGIKLMDGSLAGKGNIDGNISFNASKVVTASTKSGAFTAASNAMAASQTFSYTVAWEENGVEKSKTVNFKASSDTVFASDDGTEYTIADITNKKPTAKELANAVIAELKKDSALSSAFEITNVSDAIQFTSKVAGADGAKITALGISDSGNSAFSASSTAGAIAANPVKGMDSMQILDLSKVVALDKTTDNKPATEENMAKATFEINGHKFMLVDSNVDAKTLESVSDDVHLIKMAADAGYVAANDAAKVAAEVSRVTGEKFEVATAANTAAGIDADSIVYKGDMTFAKGDKGLTLQIGDTADEFNQMAVKIGDMHVTSLGIGGVDISTQDGAATAVDKIKAAINSVSSTRGDLGAIQNRLEHTQNNLSVMTENIQDAESTIRDTDVADEMMAYTKNNILIQSAQAMLAQANAVPQGVLQLLQ